MLEVDAFVLTYKILGANRWSLAVMTMPTLDYQLQTGDGRRGWIGEWFANENDDSLVAVGDPVRVTYFDETRIFIRYAIVFFQEEPRLTPRLCAAHPTLISRNVGPFD